MCAVAGRNFWGGGSREEKLSRRKFLQPPSNVYKTSLVKCKRERGKNQGD